MTMYHYHKSSADPKVSDEMKESRDCYCDGRDKYTAGDYQAAYDSFQKAVQMQEVLFGKYHEDTVKSYWWLGKAACQTQTEPQEALKAFQRATRTGEVALGKTLYLEMCQDIEETLALSGWAKVHAFKKSSSSPTLLGGSSRSLRLNGSGGSNHNHNSSSLSLKSLNGSGSLRNLKTSKKKLMKVLQDIIGHEQEGDRYFKQGRYTKANHYYGKALALQDETMGTDSLDGADIRCKLAFSMLKDSSATKQQAAQTLQLAYECYMNKVGENHPATYGVAAKMKTIVA
ncbi:unnamed protein product [Cylindrotheca closterium]|uniref:Kinesin light chain n=1 Tax=Cylindrotheca closterium TaxID=2856 RepID=A0AAD2G8M0_9STRA|nr:unnamed protein product [Cylindrotheca closterium]